MPKTINMRLSAESIDHTIERLKRYEQTMRNKGLEICRRLAIQCEVRVSIGFDSALYDGEKHYSVSVKKIDNGYAVQANGETVLILEFGAGITFGSGHPQADEFGYGPGTYPGQTHAMDPRGWWIPRSRGGGHTFGNPPSMAMYNAAKVTREAVERVAREVFGS